MIFSKLNLKIGKKIFWIAPIGALVLIQFIRPDLSNPVADPAQDISKVVDMPADVQSVLRAACYDCHSNETRYPWYSRVAPVSWWVANHINEGREAVNFSTFGALNAEDRAEALEESAENIREGEMPLTSYTWMHPEAVLSDSSKTILLNWLTANGGEPGESGAPEAGADEAGEDD